MTEYCWRKKKEKNLLNNNSALPVQVCIHWYTVEMDLLFCLLGLEAMKYISVVAVVEYR